MVEDQWDRLWIFGLFMDEMNGEAFDDCRKVMEPTLAVSDASLPASISSLQLTR